MKTMRITKVLDQNGRASFIGQVKDLVVQHASAEACFDNVAVLATLYSKDLSAGQNCPEFAQWARNPNRGLWPE